MLKSEKLAKITGHIIFVIVFIFFSTLEAKNLNKYDKAKNIADYFSGILLLNQSKYSESYKYLKKLDGLETNHSNYRSKYLYALISSENFNQAFIFSKKLEKEKSGIFESDIIMGIYYLKNSRHDLAKKFFLKANNRNSRSILDNYIANTLYFWSDLENKNFEKAQVSIDLLNNRFENLKKIQKVFLNCFYKQPMTGNSFTQLISNQKTDFSRYNYFYAKYLKSIGKENKAKKVIESSLKQYPRNLLLNQYKRDLETKKNNFEFNCNEEKDVLAELIYIAANALSSQGLYSLSNFYLNLAKYLNKNFYAFDTLLAENFYKINDLSTAKEIFQRSKNYGSAFKWYSNKQISKILIEQDKKDISLNLLRKTFNELPTKGIYETFDYAEFLKNNEDFENSIIHYSEILKKINKEHPLYPEATDGRGVAYERTGQWKKAERDLLASLDSKPDQAYVINYLAYSWIEQGIKIEKSLKMLERANKLKSNDPYIIDSLGWALFKLERYEESQDYLQLAVRLMPSDPIVNDHYGDVLWKNGKEIQARYFWKYVLNLKEAEKDLKDKIEKKLIKGL